MLELQEDLVVEVLHMELQEALELLIKVMQEEQVSLGVITSQEAEVEQDL